MILDQHSTLRTVFTIFGAAWIGIVAILFVATGLLLKRAETLRKKQQHSAGDHH